MRADNRELIAHSHLTNFLDLQSEINQITLINMSSEQEIQRLKSENEYLQLQLQDVNYMLTVREEELELLRDKARQGVQMQSKLEGNYNEIAQMQITLGKAQQQVYGAARREAAMEEEIIQSVHIEKNYYNTRKELASVTAAFTDVDSKLDEVTTVYKDLETARRKIAELESLNEIAKEEKEFLAYELEKLKKQNQRLQEGL